MEVYNGSFLKIQFEKENNRFINSWKKAPKDVASFKSELLMYRSCLEKHNPTQILWLQESFTFQIDVPTKMWVEENILKPRFEAGFITEDDEGYHPIAFVVGQDVMTHMKVIGVFDKPNPSVFNPRHFATEQEARDWLNKKFPILINEDKKIEITYKGTDANGKSIFELKKHSSNIKQTIYSFQRIFAENEFIKKNIEKYILLTKREKEVLGFLSKGIKHKEIAETLFISTFTVREHWKKIKKKLEVAATNELLKYHSAFQSK